MSFDDALAQLHANSRSKYETSTLMQMFSLTVMFYFPENSQYVLLNFIICTSYPYLF